jgi:hypothetical protein
VTAYVSVGNGLVRALREIPLARSAARLLLAGGA